VTTEPVTTAPAGTVTTEPAATAPTGTVVGRKITLKQGHDNVNLRRGPGTEYGKTGILLPGETAEIIAEQGEWYQVRFVDYGMEAWVHRDYVDVS
jgi:SH3-like domain-containing protein